jgi:hypothetical protein
MEISTEIKARTELALDFDGVRRKRDRSMTQL